MSDYEEDLLAAARILLARRKGQRGPLPNARVRRSISTTYYAIFHFLLDEVGRRVIGTSNDLKVRRRLLARTIGHSAIKLTLEKVRGRTVHPSIAEFVRRGGMGPLPTPQFLQDVARAFGDAHAKREDADYNLSQPLSAADARLLQFRTRRAIRAWRAANTAADKDAKQAVCLLILIKGQLRTDR